MMKNRKQKAEDDFLKKYVARPLLTAACLSSVVTPIGYAAVEVRAYGSIEEKQVCIPFEKPEGLKSLNCSDTEGTMVFY